MPGSRQTQLERAGSSLWWSGAEESGRPAAIDLVSADLLDSVLAHSPIVLWAIDSDGIFTLSTGQGLDVLEMKPGDMLGQSIFDLYGGQPTVVDSVRRALAGEELRSLVDLDGIHFDCWFAPLRTADEIIVGVRGVATVITQQKQAEQALQESEERFAKAFHSSPLGILFTRLEDGLFIDVNDTFLGIFGYSREEVVGKTSLDLKMWVDLSERDHCVQTLREHGTVHDAEYQFRSKQGKRIIARVSAEIIELDGKPCALSLCEDITEQKQTENAVREIEQRYQTLARTAPVGIFHTDAAGHCLDVNEQYASLVGLTPAEAAGEGWQKALHPDDLQRIAAEWKAAVDAGRSLRAEYRLLSRDGMTSWVLGQATPERNDAGEVTSYVGTVTGIDDFKQIERAQHSLNLELTSRIRERTNELNRADFSLREQIQERKQLFEDLLQSQARWKSVVEDAPDFILIVDQQGTISFINRTLPPYQKSDIEGANVLDFLPEEYHTQYQKNMASVFKTGELVASQIMVMGPDGSEAWYASRIGAVKVGKRIVAATIVARDITQQTQTEEEIRRRQADLAHVSRLSTMGEMAATLAHELNQPLSAISNYAAGCVRRLQAGPVDANELIKAAQTISRQASGASETIGRILDFVRKKDAVYEHVVLNELVADAIELALSEANRHRVSIFVEAAENLPMTMGDRIQIEQVLLNLIVNAIDALHDMSADHHRNIVVKTSLASQNRLQISVCDNGCGLPEDFADWIFEPFQSGKTQGIGMGLSISRSIIELHKGRLWATANDTGGATFHISLPISPGENTNEFNDR
ncbi:MAG: PAS domain S-box protein [Planctomycetaceae bacterium]|nr:PAS domain S-box protein [Planctomycetaceae bacterium]